MSTAPAAVADLSALPLLRPVDWPERLAAFLEERRRVPFAWGANDCVSFAADAAVAITGRDPLGGLRGRWRSESDAARLLQSMGGLEAACHAVLGDPREGAAAKYAPRGAIVCVVISGERPTVGIVAGNGCWCAPGEQGLVFRPMSEVSLAWEV